MSQTILGISGVACSGKDTLCKLLINEFLQSYGVEARRFALADELKLQVRERCLREFGIDSTTCSGADKEKIRPLLVAYGKEKRLESNGQYWTGFLEKKIRGSGVPVAIVTDIRYAYYQKDEVWWVKEQMGGSLIHVTQFDPKTRKDTEPPNEDERINDPLVKAQADFKIRWPKVAGPDYLRVLEGFVYQFFNYGTCEFSD